MNTLQRERRARRKAELSLEYLDERIVPSAMHAAAGAGAEAAAVSTAQIRHERRLGLLVAQHARHLARLQASPLANHSDAAFAARTPMIVNVNTTAAAEAAATGPGTGASPSLATQAGTVTPVSAFLANLLGNPRRTPTLQRANPAPANPAPVNPTPVNPTPANPTPANPTPANTTSPGPLPANVSGPLQSLYSQYQSGSLTPSGVGGLVINGTDVGIQAHSNGSDFNAFVAALKSDGLQVITADATTGTVEGMVAMSQLPTVAQAPGLLSLTPMYQSSHG